MVNTSRRRFLQAASVSGGALVAGCLLSSAGHPVTEPVGSWASFRGGRHNTGFARGVSPVSSDPAVKWTVDTTGPVWASPAVAAETVYVGSADRSVYAIDAETGETRWRFETEHRIEGSPAYANGTVYLGSYDRHVYAIDAETGDLRWKHETEGLIRGSPTVVDGAVYIGTGCHNLACEWYAEDADVPEGGAVYSLDAQTGEVRWRHGVDDEVVSTPAVVDGTVYVGSSDETMYALDAASGTVVWTYDVDDMVWSSPAVAFGTVYFGDWDAMIHAVDATSGVSRWTFETGGHYISSSPAVDEETLYVGHTPRNFPEPGVNYAEVFAIDRVSGEKRWSFETNSTEIGSSPVVTDDRLYVSTHQPSETDGNGVYALTTEGEEEWFLPIAARGVGSSPALIDGTLYFGGTDGSVYAIE